MAVHVMEAESRKLIDEGVQAIMLESDIEDKERFYLAIRELQHADTRKAAIVAAGKIGISNARVGMRSHPYPVDQEGDTVVRPMDQEVFRYRIEVEVTDKGV